MLCLFDAVDLIQLLSVFLLLIFFHGFIKKKQKNIAAQLLRNILSHLNFSKVFIFGNHSLKGKHHFPNPNLYHT